jgi:hypothetical protein
VDNALIALHLVPLVLLALAFATYGVDLRAAVMEASLVWVAIAVAVTEALGAFGLLDRPRLAMAHSLVAVAAAALLVTRRSHRPAAWRFPRPGLREIGMCAIVVLIASLTLATALAAPPNNPDSQTYRLPRIEHWIQNRSLALYPTHIERQVALPALAEIVILQGRLLTGGDRFAAVVQWLAALGSIVGVSLIARHLGAGRTGQCLAAVLCSTVPMGIVQSNSTQNDYVTAYFLVVAVERLLCAVRTPATRPALGVALGTGLALATKGTAYLIGFPFGLWFLLSTLVERGRRAVVLLVICAAVMLSPNLPTFGRNVAAFGNVLGNHGSFTNNASFGPVQTVDNFLRNLVMHFAREDPRWNQALIEAVNAVGSAIGAERYRNDTTMVGTRFALPSFEGWKRWEDVAGNPIHTLASLAAVVLVVLTPGRRRDRMLLGYAAALALGVVLYSAVIRWQPWGSRLQLPLYVLATPLVAAVTARRLCTMTVCALAALVTVAGWPFVIQNQARPLWPRPIWRQARDRALFATLPHLEQPYRDVAAFVRTAGFRRVGLVFGPDDWEYPLWILLTPRSPGDIRIEHVSVTNATATFRYPLGPFQPDALIGVATAATVRGALASGTWVKAFESPPLDVYVRTDRRAEMSASGARSGPRVLQDAPEGANSVLPRDLLALLVRPAGVRDPDLVDPAAKARDLRDDLGLEAEAVLLERDLPEHLPRERLVAALDVRQVEVRGHVRQKGEHAIAHGVPEVEHPVRATAEEP